MDHVSTAETEAAVVVAIAVANEMIVRWCGTCQRDARAFHSHVISRPVQCWSDTKRNS